MTSPPADTAETSQRLTAIVDYVRDCENRVARGEIMDLQGLDRNVISLCEAIAALPPAEARQLEMRMLALIESLDRLAHGMKEQQDKLAAAGGR